MFFEYKRHCPENTLLIQVFNLLLSEENIKNELKMLSNFNTI